MLNGATRQRIERLARERERHRLESIRVALRPYQKRSASPAGSISVTSHYEPVTNGSVGSPEILFAAGDVVMAVVPN